jgi:hypothetical protein
MENNFNNNFDSINNIIRGSYTPIINWQNIDFSNKFYITDLNILIKTHMNEQKYYEKKLYDTELSNIKLLQYINLLNKKCNLENTTHSNTINFILQNYRQLRYVLNNLLIIYNNNLNYITLTKEKIYDITISINTLKSNINDYTYIYKY